MFHNNSPHCVCGPSLTESYVRQIPCATVLIRFVLVDSCLFYQKMGVLSSNIFFPLCLTWMIKEIFCFYCDVHIFLVFFNQSHKQFLSKILFSLTIPTIFFPQFFTYIIAHQPFLLKFYSHQQFLIIPTIISNFLYKSQFFG